MYKGIFIHVPKAAGTSMMTAFEPYQESSLVTEKTSFMKNPILPLPLLHMFHFRVSRAEVMRSVVGKYRWDSTFKFCFVRNPWDRYVSNWHWLTRTGQRTGWADRGWKGADGEISFADFVHQIGAAYNMPSEGYQHDKWHVRNQIEHITDGEGNLMMDFVGRVENIEKDFRHVCKEIGHPEIELPHLNHVGYHAGGERVEEEHYSTHYTPELVALVADRARADIEAFGYEFEDASEKKS
jgi:chondroitin 4-sulfotransferase 11